MLFLSIALAVHGALHLIAWRWTFPTSTERLLWRLACFGLILGQLPEVVVVGIFRALGAYVSWQMRRIRESGGEMGDLRVVDKLEGVMRKHASPVTLCILMLVTSASSTYLFIESFLALRSSVAGVYERIDWSVFLPSIG